MRLYYSQNLFTSCIGAVSDVFTGVGTRFYHSEKVFTSCIGVVLDVFARVRSRLYHSQKIFTSCTYYIRGAQCFHGCRNAPLSFAKTIYRVYERASAIRKIIYK